MLKFKIKINSHPSRLIRDDEFLFESVAGDISDENNIDVQITLEDGRCFAATFFTIKNLSTLLRSYEKTGEGAGGVYIWAVDMIVVEKISDNVIVKTVRDLIVSGEIENACSRIK